MADIYPLVAGLGKSRKMAVETAVGVVIAYDLVALSVDLDLEGHDAACDR